jgi:HK97 family phage portal protein
MPARKLVAMSFASAFLSWLTKPVERAIRLSDASASVPPARSRGAARNVEPTAALSLSTVYRGIMIHATAVAQLSINVERHGVQLTETPALVVTPDIDESRSAFLEYTVNSLYLDGNAFWKITRGPAGEVINLTPLNPREVGVNVQRDTFGKDHVTYWYAGKEHTSRDIKHLKLLRVPGLHRGLGPIQAAQIELAGALDARDYGALWLSDANMPDGILTTDQVLGPGDAEKYKNVWYGRNQDGTDKDTTPNPAERLRVLGQGLHYSALLLKPSDVQFLETQQFTTTQIARLLGTPASLLLAAVEGNSQTYSNVEQDWIGYVRFSLMKPLREIEEALTDVLPGKQTARFNLAVLLRTDTKTRYESYSLALASKWMTADEVRQIEGLPALTDEQHDQLATQQTATPAALTYRKEITDA